jgi:molybdopterin-guanine dinucleotide biosynthesis protein A
VDFSAVVLAGGTAVRLGGVDKAGIELDGVTFLERALAAVAAADDVVVVGGQVPTSRPVTFVREDPPLGGPAAGMLAGLSGLARPAAYVVVLAVDMPLVTAATIGRLIAAGGGDGAILVDGSGRRQPALVVRRSRLPAPGTDVHGRSLWSLLDGVDLVEVAAVGTEAAGVDTWADLRDLQP